MLFVAKNTKERKKKKQEKIQFVRNNVGELHSKAKIEKDKKEIEKKSRGKEKMLGKKRC